MREAHYLALLNQKRTQASVFHYIFCLRPTRFHKQDPRVRLNEMFYTQKKQEEEEEKKRKKQGMLGEV